MRDKETAACFREHQSQTASMEWEGPMGPPGIGKTRFTRRIAECLSVPFAALSVGGESDSRNISGTAKGWSSAHPGFVPDRIAVLRCAGPLIFLDEIDKVSVGGYGGDIDAAILSMLEPESARAWRDPIVDACDLSRVSWVMAANDVARVRGPLLSRLRVVQVDPPPESAFDSVLKGILRDIARDLGGDAWALPALEEADAAWLRERWRETRSPRILRKLVERLLAAAAERPPERLH